MNEEKKDPIEPVLEKKTSKSKSDKSKKVPAKAVTVVGAIDEVFKAMPADMRQAIVSALAEAGIQTEKDLKKKGVAQIGNRAIREALFTQAIAISEAIRAGEALSNCVTLPYTDAILKVCQNRNIDPNSFGNRRAAREFAAILQEAAGNFDILNVLALVEGD